MDRKEVTWMRRSSKPLCGEAQGGVEVGEGLRVSAGGLDVCEEDLFNEISRIKMRLNG